MPDPDAVRSRSLERRAATGAAGSGAGLGYGAVGSVATRTPVPRSTYRPPSIRTTAGGQYTKPMPVPTASAGGIPDIGAFLGSDISYQDQLRQFAQALADMNADVTRRRGTIGTQFETSKKGMADQRVKDLSNIEADYGARGLLRSGLYAKAQGDYETEYNNRLQDLTTQNTSALGQLDQELNQYQSQQNLQQQAAREAAIRRRAEQYGV